MAVTKRYIDNRGANVNDAERNAKSTLKAMGFQTDMTALLGLAARAYVQRRKMAGVSVLVMYYLSAELGQPKFMCSRLIVGYMYFITPNNMGSSGQGIMFYSHVAKDSNSAEKEFLRLAEQLDKEVDDD